MLNKTNEATFLILTLIFTTPIILSFDPKIHLFMALISMIFIGIFYRIQIKPLFLVLILLIPSTFSIFITALIWSDIEGKIITFSIFNTIFFETNKGSLSNAISLSSRTAALTISSTAFFFSMDYEKLVFSLMQNFKLSPKIGFALLSACNSFQNIKDEFIKIRTAHKMRNTGMKNICWDAISLIVTAARQASTAALSIESRGLSSDRTYMEKYNFNKIDYFILLLGAIGCALIIILIQYV